MLRILRSNRLLSHMSRRFLQAEGVRVPDLHEPAYLAELKPKVGFYERLDLAITGYDYTVLEKYQSYINRKMARMEFEITAAWSSPCKEILIEVLTDRSTALETAYKVKLYERNIGMRNALVTKLPLLIDLLHSTLPPGVKFSIDRPTAADEDRIHFRDSVLDNYKEELQELKDTPLIGA